MNEHERKLFNGKCPYTGKWCSNNIDCKKCEVNESEQNLYDEEKEDLHDKEKEDKIKQQLFKLSYGLDSKSAEKDYVALRNLHYDNVQWIHNNGLQEEYYQYFFKKLNEERNDIHG